MNLEEAVDKAREFLEKYSIGIYQLKNVRKEENIWIIDFTTEHPNHSSLRILIDDRKGKVKEVQEI